MSDEAALTHPPLENDTPDESGEGDIENPAMEDDESLVSELSAAAAEPGDIQNPPLEGDVAAGGDVELENPPLE